ncbi:type II secretion system minor pseudopilin GspH [Aestuariibacter sp. AA17]|uniref:Type II secretion system protein H n=1 Tax=Fluctibacter corallii TaxID=2984329 RepID=A0ABT3AB13_9ALTE|nr:type II secretion system minor pseudopilin GspH [Aestuariibacter sp. AA17]MCV2885804.1 type II secretion system minor pseudopilin GspH [Aestuariibacter sp. AA17]
MSAPACFKNNQSGFTLLEVMLVLTLMGLAVGYVVFNAFGTSSTERLEKEVTRFQVVINMASDFAVLNQQELGLYLDKEKQSYTFLLLDEEQKWQPLEQDKVFSTYALPENVEMQIELDDLPWEAEESLFDDELFDEELSVRDAGVEIGEEEDKPHPPPQVMLFSSGEMTPFVVSLAYEPDFGNDDPVYYKVLGKDVPPVTREGPLDSL